MAQSNKKKLALVGLVSILGLSALLIHFLAPLGDTDGFAFKFEPGTVYHYRIDFAVDNATSISFDLDGKDSDQHLLNGKLALVGDLLLKSYGIKGDSQYLGITFANLETTTFVFNDQDLFEDAAIRAVLEQNEALIKLSSQGRVLDLQVPSNLVPAFGNAVQTVLGEMQVIVENRLSTWQSEEECLNGNYVGSYKWQNQEGDHLALLKERDAYSVLNVAADPEIAKNSSLETRYDIRLHKDGYLFSLEGQEQLVAVEENGNALLEATTKSSFLFTGTSQFDLYDGMLDGLLASRLGRRLGQVVISADARLKALKQRISGMTIDNVTGDLLKYANSGQVPFLARWLWRATGLLESDPKLCWQLVDVFKDTSLNDQGRNAVLDLLVATGHKEAQKVLIALLKSPEALKKGNYLSMLQRLSRLTEPDSDVGEFVSKLLDATRSDPDSGFHTASAYTLGAIAGHHLQNGNEQDAHKYSQEIVHLLEKAEGEEEISAYLHGLGNVGDEDNVEVVAEFASHDSPEVRVSALAALRKTQTDLAEKVVISTISDPYYGVQLQALKIIQDYDLDENHVSQLRTLVSDNTIQPQNYSPLILAVEQAYRQTGPVKQQARDTLKVLLKKELGDEMRFQIRKLLGVGSSAGAANKTMKITR